MLGNKNNIILIGMPGVGKSTIGVVLAKKLGYGFLDSDLIIQETEDKLLHDIILKEGLEGFLSIENKINASIEKTNSIIATGGSVVYGNEAMAHLNEIGTIVYLKLSYESIENRLGDLHERGVALQDGQTLKELYLERIPLYEKYADLEFDCENKMIREIVNELQIALHNVE